MLFSDEAFFVYVFIFLLVHFFFSLYFLPFNLRKYQYTENNFKLSYKWKTDY